MFYRILYTIWRIFWSSLLVLAATLLLFSGLLVLLLQSNPVRNYLLDRAETWFEHTFEGTLQIGAVSGILPVRMDLQDVALTYDDDTVARFETLRLRTDLIGMLRSSVTVKELSLNYPEVYLRVDDQGVYTIARALGRTQQPHDDSQRTGGDRRTVLEQTFEKVAFYAPHLQLYNGTLHVVDPPSGMPAQEPFRIDSISTELFLEISRGQRYLDISYLRMIPDHRSGGKLTLSGQIYNDDRYLEFNAMRLRTGPSHLDGNLVFDGVNLFSEAPAAQLRRADWLLNVRRLYLDADDPIFAGAGLPDAFSGLHAAFDAAGSADTLTVSDAEITSGRTTLRFHAGFSDPFDRERFTYHAEILETELYREDLAMLHPRAGGIPFYYGSAVSLRGRIRGDSDTLRADLETQLPEGRVTAGGTLGLSRTGTLEMTLSGREVNPAALDGLDSWSGLLNMELLLKAENLLEPSRRITADLQVFDSRLTGFYIPDLHADLTWEDRILTHEISYYQSDSYVTGSGFLNLQGEKLHIVASGRSSDLNLRAFTNEMRLPESSWNMSYDINWHGWNPGEWYGRLIVDVFPSRLNGTDLGSHQLYLDLNDPALDGRSLRVTSSVADLVMEGDFSPAAMPRLIRQWQGYVDRHVRQDLLFQKRNIAATEWAPGSSDDLMQADLFFEIKNLDLLRAYLPELPEATSRLQLDATVRTDHEKLAIRSRWRDDHASWNGIGIRDTDIALDAELRYGQPLSVGMELDVDLRVGQLNFMDQQFDGITWLLGVTQGSLSNRIRIENFGNQLRFATDIEGTIDSTQISITLEDLVAGDRRYLWNAANRPVLRYGEDGKLHVRDLQLISGNDRIYVDGIFSNDPFDSVTYRFVTVDLERISAMIDGRVNFQGLLDGNLVTRNVTVNPVFHGRLDVDRLAFNDRIIGDVTLESTFNAAMERFDTELLVITDEEKYEDYINRNNGRRQHVTATGWLRAPDLAQPDDSLYYFDIDFKDFDAWVLRYLMESIFESIEGRGRGSGYLTGNFSDLDFHGEFEILDAEVIPVFLEPHYRLDGQVTVNRHEGVIIERLNVRDESLGRGVVTGYFDFNDFQPEKFMDITMEMQNLRFLDNRDGPDVPLYGSISGTGVVNISGSNVSPFVRTIEPVTTTSQSRLSIPLIGQSMDEAQGRFIQFVRDFDEADIRHRIRRDPAALRQIDRTFTEVFRMDLQFVAGPNSTVQLIFDPVTGEIVNAQGSGRVRIILEDEDFQIFGNFDITSGDYLFVGGDILTRRFILRDGGSIRLDGDPTNALLDITAVYRSRPNIAPLLGAVLEQTNRVPVELLLRITGPIDNIENDFYFEFPNAIDATQNAAVLNVLNSEEQKLIQATSLLFTGGFLSGALVGATQTQELGTTLQARAGQVGISQLLSTQINALLSDNLLNVDVDLNLFGFDQADLAIALRLFDDRLVLRREGEVGGEEASIGDLGATYRINPNLSVEVFHRKDPMLMSILGTQADVENVNGLGLEAQFRFNSWREFGNRMWRNVTTLFGLVGSRDTDQTTAGESADERSGPDPGTADLLSLPVFGILNDRAGEDPARADPDNVPKQ